MPDGNKHVIFLDGINADLVNCQGLKDLFKIVANQAIEEASDLLMKQAKLANKLGIIQTRYAAILQPLLTSIGSTAEELLGVENMPMYSLLLKNGVEEYARMALQIKDQIQEIEDLKARVNELEEPK